MDSPPFWFLDSSPLIIQGFFCLMWWCQGIRVLCFAWCEESRGCFVLKWGVMVVYNHLCKHVGHWFQPGPLLALESRELSTQMTHSCSMNYQVHWLMMEFNMPLVIRPLAYFWILHHWYIWGSGRGRRLAGFDAPFNMGSAECKIEWNDNFDATFLKN